MPTHFIRSDDHMEGIRKNKQKTKAKNNFIELDENLLPRANVLYPVKKS